MALALQQRLLHMISASSGARGNVEDLAPGDWARLLVMARQQHLEPQLHWRATEGGTHGPTVFPKPFAEAIAAGFQRHTLRSMELRAEMSRVQRIMRENEIPAVFLKGAYLAFQGYPRAALRPMRNLDLLVPEDQAADAYHALQSSTLRRPGDRATNEPMRRIPVEVHTRLSESAQGNLAKRADPALNAQTWNRLICSVVAEEEVWYLSHADQLLHLMIDAVYDMAEHCGPLVLSDIVTLLGHAKIDWPQFWRLAAAGRWVPGCWLLLNLTRHFYPGLKFDVPMNVELDPLPADLAATAAILTLGKLDDRMATLRQLKLQVRNGPLHFVLELFSQSRRAADVV